MTDCITVRGSTVRVLPDGNIKIEGCAPMTLNEAEEYLFGSYYWEINRFHQFTASLREYKWQKR